MTESGAYSTTVCRPSPNRRTCPWRTSAGVVKCAAAPGAASGRGVGRRNLGRRSMILSTTMLARLAAAGLPLVALAADAGAQSGQGTGLCGYPVAIIP